MLTATQTRFRRQDRTKPDAFAVMMLICLALLVVMTVVQVAHVHAAASDSDHCPLCIVMHSAVPIAVTAAAITLVQIAEAAPVLQVRAATRHWHPQLFTRPPPTGC